MTRVVTIVDLAGVTEAGYAIIFTWLGLPAPMGFALSLVKTLRSLAAAGILVGLMTIARRLIPTSCLSVWRRPLKSIISAPP
jgi:hypothetical protein